MSKDLLTDCVEAMIPHLQKLHARHMRRFKRLKKLIDDNPNPQPTDRLFIKVDDARHECKYLVGRIATLNHSLVTLGKITPTAKS